MKVWFGVASNSIGFVTLTEEGRHELCFFYSLGQLLSILKDADESQAKKVVIEMAKSVNMPTEAEEASVVLRGDVVHMMAYFLKPVLGNLQVELLSGNRSKPLPDSVVQGEHPETILVPPRDDDVEPAGLLFNPAQSVATFFFSQEQGRQLLARRSAEENPEDKERLSTVLRTSVLPQHSNQLPINLADPFGYYLFCGYLLQNR